MRESAARAAVLRSTSPPVAQIRPALARRISSISISAYGARATNSSDPECVLRYYSQRDACFAAGWLAFAFAVLRILVWRSEGDILRIVASIIRVPCSANGQTFNFPRSPNVRYYSRVAVKMCRIYVRISAGVLEERKNSTNYIAPIIYTAIDKKNVKIYYDGRINRIDITLARAAISNSS